MAIVDSKITRRNVSAATASAAFFEAARAETAQTDLPDDLRKTMEEYHRAEVAFQKGDPQPFKDICSHADGVTIVGGMGGVEKGWANVEKRVRMGCLKVFYRQQRATERDRFSRCQA